MSTRTVNQDFFMGYTGELQPLGDDDQSLVNGGFVPVVGFAVALGAHIGIGGAATTFTGHVLSGIGLGLASYGLSAYLSER